MSGRRNSAVVAAEKLANAASLKSMLDAWQEEKEATRLRRKPVPQLSKRYRAESAIASLVDDDEQQHNFDIMTLLTPENVRRLRDAFALRDDELSVSEFVAALGEALRQVPSVEFAKEAIELFAQIDVNGDGGMEWSEFTAYIIEAGLAAKAAEEQDRTISTAYKLHHSKSKGKRVERMVYLQAPATCVAVFTEDVDVITLLDLPIAGRDGRARTWTALRHHNQMKPQEVTAVCVIPSRNLLATASHESETGPYLLNLWSLTKTPKLLHRFQVPARTTALASVSSMARDNPNDKRIRTNLHT